MRILDFLVLKNENFGSKNPYEQFLGDFGQFWKNRKKWAPIQEGGGRKFVVTQNFGKNFFFRTCNFFEKWNFKKKNFFGQSLDDKLSAKSV